MTNALRATPLATLFAGLGLLAGCVQIPAPAPTPTPTPAPAAAARPALPERVLFADFGKNPRASNQGADPYGFAYSERRGDAAVHSVAVEGTALRLRGFVGNVKGSQWAGVGFTLGGTAAMDVVDLSSYSRLRVRLASSTAKALRVRIASTDEKINNLGCYPLLMVNVTPVPTDYDLPMARFAPESYCGENARRIGETLKAVKLVEVADATITGKDTEFSLERVEFLR